MYLYEKPDNDRVKLLVLYIGEEDFKLNMAAAGALAQLTESSEKVCHRLFEVTSFVPIFKQAACTIETDLQFRIFYILKNIALWNKELAFKVVSTELCEVITAMSRIDIEREREKVNINFMPRFRKTNSFIYI